MSPTRILPGALLLGAVLATGPAEAGGRPWADEPLGYGPSPRVYAEPYAAVASGPIVVEYREPYLPVGILYNIPPSPDFARGRAIRARY